MTRCLLQHQADPRFLNGSCRITSHVAATLLFLGTVLSSTSVATARPIQSEQTRDRPIHPVAEARELDKWLARVPTTRLYPPDFAETLKGQSSLYVIEMSTARGCVPCAHLWRELSGLSSHYGWQLRTIPAQEAVFRSGRLGLPWLGNPVAWVHPIADPSRTIPIAIGTDHAANLARNLYLAAKMLTGVRPAIAVRGMAKFTGIVGAANPLVKGR